MTTLLIIAIIVLTAVVLAQILKVQELVSLSKGKLPFEITEKDSQGQAKMMLVFLVGFFAFILWQIARWGHAMLPEAASVHGESYDSLMNVTLIIISIPFVVCNIILFWFAYRYAYSSKRTALYFSHSNKLELIWTIIPSVALAILILYGLSNWNSLMKPLPEDQDKITIELYAKQFDWTARFAGADEKLGRANFKLIEGLNALGVDKTDKNAADDKIVKGEMHIPVNKAIQLVMRSQDVIHSAYLPHFRVQMNCVPGMKTQFNFVPKYTTQEMRKITNNPDFDYILLCNKICGAAHYNMQMKVVVDSEEDYNKWLAEQKTFSEIVK